jgi:hypothetical protein
MKPSAFSKLVVLVVSLSAGCESPDPEQQAISALRAKIGYRCTVQFRRDALGAAAAVPVPPTTDNINGADVTLSGKLKDVKGDWLVLEYQRGVSKPTEYWIARNSILSLEWSAERLK